MQNNEKVHMEMIHLRRESSQSNSGKQNYIKLKPVQRPTWSTSEATNAHSGKKKVFKYYLYVWVIFIKATWQ